MKNNKLILVAQESGLQEDKIQNLMSSFGDAYREARDLVKGAKEIVVEDENQTEEMDQARELRLELKHIRTKKVEEVRKKLKEQSLREGKAIDGMANIIKALIVPAEEYLLNQEKFAERMQAEKDNRVEAERNAKLTKYTEDADLQSLHPNNLSTESFDKLLETYKFAFETKKKAEEDAEKERLAKEKADSEERDRIKKENAKLKAEAEIQEKQLAKERKEQQEKIDTEIEKREAIEEKVRIEKLAEDAKLKAEADLKQKALLAPDKEKLMKLAQTIALIQYPALASKQAQDICEDTMNKIVEIAKELEEKSKTL